MTHPKKAWFFPVFAFLFCILFSLFSSPASAQMEAVSPDSQPYQDFVKGKVVKVVSEERDEIFGQNTLKQVVVVGFKEGDVDQYKEVEAVYNDIFAADQKHLVVGDTVVMTSLDYEGERVYEVVDFYRLPSLIWIIAGFVILVLVIAQGKGFTALAGLVFSFFAISELMIPGLLKGYNIYLVTIGVAAIIAFVTYFVAHGFGKKSNIAFVSTIISLVVAVVLAFIAVKLARIFGNPTDTTLYIQAIYDNKFNLVGLLMASVIIGLLGVLDDVTFTQTSLIEELKKANPNYNFKDLFTSGFRVGKEHIVALVNTLFLVYVGVALPLFLLLKANVSQPLWVIINSETFAEEIIRTFAASSALILAVPLSTALAAYYYSKKKTNIPFSKPDQLDIGPLVD